MDDFNTPVTEIVRMDNEDEDLLLVFDVPIGEYENGVFNAPDYPRSSYVDNRKHSEHYMNGVDYAPTKERRILHIGESYENYYSEEFRYALEELSRRLPFILRIGRGYSPQSIDDSSHSIGIAADIVVEDESQARLVADTAWMIGIRGIAIGPFFVHLDGGPPATWQYKDLPLYGGPNTLPKGRWLHG